MNVLNNIQLSCLGSTWLTEPDHERLSAAWDKSKSDPVQNLEIQKNGVGLLQTASLEEMSANREINSHFEIQCVKFYSIIELIRMTAYIL